MKKFKILFLSMLFLMFSVSMASAESLIYEWAFNIDGDITGSYWDDAMPVTGDTANFDVGSDGTGLGELTWTTSATGDHSFFAFFDLEVDRATNTFFNEFGSATGTPSAGQSWEIDDPYYGYIYGDLAAGELYNDNYLSNPDGDDVSMAMGWEFNLDEGETATITLLLSESMPTGFFLQQTDDNTNIYFSSSLDIRGGGEPPPVPEPATMLLLGSGLAGLFGFRKRFGKK